MISEDGDLVDVLRAEKVVESMEHDMDRIIRSLLLGSNIPSGRGPKIFTSVGPKISRSVGVVGTETEPRILVERMPWIGKLPCRSLLLGFPLQSTGDIF